MKRTRTPQKPTGSDTPLADISPQLLGDLQARDGLSGSPDAAQNSTALLQDMQDRLSLEARELQRMEYEGGTPLHAAQKVKANACLRISNRIKTMLHSMAKKRTTPKRRP